MSYSILHRGKSHSEEMSECDNFQLIDFLEAIAVRLSPGQVSFDGEKSYENLNLHGREKPSEATMLAELEIIKNEEKARRTAWFDENEPA